MECNKQPDLEEVWQNLMQCVNEYKNIDFFKISFARRQQVIVKIALMALLEMKKEVEEQEIKQENYDINMINSMIECIEYHAKIEDRIFEFLDMLEKSLCQYPAEDEN